MRHPTPTTKRPTLCNLLVLAVVLAVTTPAGDAAADKGRVRAKTSLERTERGMALRQKQTVSKGLRSRITGGMLGKQLALTQEQRGDGVTVGVKIGRDRMERTTTASPTGTTSSSSYTRRGVFRNRTRATREDEVSRDRVTEIGARHRFFKGSVKTLTTRTTGRSGDTEVEVERVRRDGSTRSMRAGRDGDRSRPGVGKVAGERSIERRGDGMEMVETQTKRWGVLSRLSGGRLGKQAKVTTTQRQDGLRVELATRKATMTRDTAIDGSGRTRSFGTVARKGRVVSRDQATVTEGRAELVTENLRRGGTVKKVVGEELTADTARKVTQGLRRDGSARSVSIKESSTRADGKKNWKRSFALKTRSGKTIVGLDLGRADGKTGLHLTAGKKTVGTKTQIESDGAGRISAR